MSKAVLSNLSSWNRAVVEPVGDQITRQVIRTPAATIVKVDFRSGATVPLHHHVHEQVTIVESGRLRLEVDGGEIILEPGDILRIPPDVPHSTVALADSCTLEFFTPAREDIPCPDDTFLR